MKINSFKKDGITYFEVYAGCPVCIDHLKGVPQSYWTHGDDNCCGEMYVGENAHFYCRKCEILKPWHSWSYTEHKEDNCCTDNRFFINVEESQPHLSFIVSIAGQMVSATGIGWLTTIFENMNKI